MKNRSIYIILISMIVLWGSFVIVNFFSNPIGFLSYLGFINGNSGTILGWALALLTIIIYCYSASKLSDVKNYMFRMDKLKVVAILAAIFAGIMEEIIYRKWIIDYLNSHDYSIVLQVILSGFAFGIIHLMWGIKNIKAGINAFISTSLLGVALAIVYVISERSLAPCIIAHSIITALIEPGLLIAAKNNKLDYW
ncbi:CPBP family intramembrane glutamic endopeptidase [Aquimarina aggregata]|nr:CPBP family intramembrane glutamic endopeptidase [Aquimarina aggregata]